MATLITADRYEYLKTWMQEHNISFPALGEKLGIAGVTARRACKNETCPTEHHAKMITLGFPVELLPIPMDKPKGKQRKEPRFPGLPTTEIASI